MKKDKRNFICEVDTCVCAPREEAQIEKIAMGHSKKIEMYYYTDPICSSRWVVEPELKKIKLEYEDYVDIFFRMVRLLPGWEGFADKANGIGMPSEVGSHWDEVGETTVKSIDGDVWEVDPLDSSFPPSIAYKAVQMQGDNMDIDFLRKIREMVFLEKKNITKEDYLIDAVRYVGGDAVRFIKDFHDSKTTFLFQEEMNSGRQMGVRGFATFIFMSQDGIGCRLSGMSGYDNYIKALEQAYGKKPTPKPIKMTELDLVEKYGYLATKEISFILDQSDKMTEINLNDLVDRNKAIREVQKYGNFWRLKCKHMKVFD